MYFSENTVSKKSADLNRSSISSDNEEEMFWCVCEQTLRFKKKTLVVGHSLYRSIHHYHNYRKHIKIYILAWHLHTCASPRYIIFFRKFYHAGSPWKNEFVRETWEWFICLSFLFESLYLSSFIRVHLFESIYSSSSFWSDFSVFLFSRKNLR